ncbi:MAG TPA: hypothetical protein VHV78_14670, partial [Gemmatimonadaceae bacterium]|nr:hypothetical protein [Gemmatimonadaceae bacterium]
MFVATSCGGGDTGPLNQTPSTIAIASGNGQVGLIRATLAAPLAVSVSTNGSPLAGVAVTFAITSGTGTLSATTATSDANGQAKTTLTLSSTVGNVTVTADVPGTSLSVVFLEAAGAATLTQACQSGPATMPALGAVSPGVGGSGICLGGGAAGADYALVAFYGNSDNSASTSINVQSHGGAIGVTVASVVPSKPEGLRRALRYQTNETQSRFDAALREAARRELTPLIPAARLSAGPLAAFAAIPASPTIGTLFTLNANGNAGESCTNPIDVTARVAAVSNTAIVVADTANPAGGFTDAEYGSFATMFDTLISPLDVSNFGQPSDIDKNGRIIIFFTKEVNKLTPAGSAGEVGGFFDERDLFPTTTTTDLQGCPTSNFAEMFYVIVPDPTGKYNNARSKASVQELAPGTLAHEYQHLINAGRRLYVNDADTFEEVWLNEGLSHIAEELLYYRVARLTPRENIGISTVAADMGALSAFNE